MSDARDAKGRDVVDDASGPLAVIGVGCDADYEVEIDEEPETADDVADAVFAEGEADPASGDELDRVRAWQARVLDAERCVAERSDVWEVAKRAANAAKKAYDSAVDDLRDTIRELGEPSLFERTAAAASGGNVPVRTEGGIRAEFSDEWRKVPVDRLCAFGLPAAVVALLVEGDLPTIGDIADWTAGGKMLTDLDGIGEAKAEAIDDSLTRFWSEWNREGGED